MRFWTTQLSRLYVTLLIVTLSFGSIANAEDVTSLNKSLQVTIDQSLKKYREALAPELMKCPVRIYALKIYKERNPKIASSIAVDCPGGSTTTRLDGVSIESGSRLAREIGNALSNELKIGVMDHVPTHLIEFFESDANDTASPVFVCTISVFHDNMVFSYPCDRRLGDSTSVSSELIKIVNEVMPLPVSEVEHFKRIRGIDDSPSND